MTNIKIRSFTGDERKAKTNFDYNAIINYCDLVKSNYIQAQTIRGACWQKAFSRGEMDSSRLNRIEKKKQLLDNTGDSLDDSQTNKSIEYNRSVYFFFFLNARYNDFSPCLARVHNNLNVFTEHIRFNASPDHFAKTCKNRSDFSCVCGARVNRINRNVSRKFFFGNYCSRPGCLRREFAKMHRTARLRSTIVFHFHYKSNS